MSDEHEFEPSYGLPELLPSGERLLWQGSPDWRALARDALHLRALAVYFGLMLAWRSATLLADGAGWLATAGSVGALAGLALTALATLGVIAWLIGRTSIYTVTDRRVVLRIGVVLSVTFNLPYCRIDAAGLRLKADGTGDIPLRLVASDRIGLVHLWPHARPWQFTRTQPMLRAIPEAARVAGLMSTAMAAAAGMAAPEPVRAAANGTPPDVVTAPAATAGATTTNPPATAPAAAGRRRSPGNAGGQQPLAA